MADPGSFAQKVKEQADIVRVVGDYVRLKKSGQNFMGLCPFHSEKTPSFAVHPGMQIFRCFGCGQGGDVFTFIELMEKVTFPEAVRMVAEKCGIPLPKVRYETPVEERAARERAQFYEIHEQAQLFFLANLRTGSEGRLVRDYLQDRGLTSEQIERFGIGYAPAGGDALYRKLRSAGFSDELLKTSGLVLRDDSGRFYDRFRRRVMFPIHTDGGKLIAFGGRAMGDDLPKYMNSPETPIYSKGRVLYNLNRAKESVRKLGYAVLVEGYMDVIGVDRAGVGNVVASCGTSLTETQVRILHRYATNAVVNYDPDSAGVGATERSLELLLEAGFDTKVLVLPAGQDPDKFVATQGVEAYRKVLKSSPAYLEYLAERVRTRSDLTTAQGKLAAINFLLPYVARIPDRVVRSHWITLFTEKIGVDDPVLRAAVKKALAEKRTSVEARTELLARAVKPAERRLIQIVLENDAIRGQILEEIHQMQAHRGLASEAIFENILALGSGGRIDVKALQDRLGESERKLLYEVIFEPGGAGDLAEARSCLESIAEKRLEREAQELQKAIEEAERAGDAKRLRELLARKKPRPSSMR